MGPLPYMAASEQVIAAEPIVIRPALAARPDAAVTTINSAARIPALDGLRGAAILLVLLCLSVFEMHPQSRLLRRMLGVGTLAWSGVDLFFVLSGFLIGGILL